MLPVHVSNKSTGGLLLGLAIATLFAGCGGGGDSSIAGATSASLAATSAVASSLAAKTALNPTSTSTAVVLPLEVIGAAGSVVTVQVSAPRGVNATRLYMQVNNLSYDNKASVQINNGAWIPLTNAAVTVQGAAASYGGIGGGFDTIKLTVPIRSAVNGTNTIRFRFNNSDGVSAGYRVLDFNLLDSSGTLLVDKSTYAQDDPTTWVAPDNNATDIAAGKTLWQSATLANSPLSPTSMLQSHCMDCHTANGSDLQRFNYSNYSIVARAQYHGLSQTQGLQIASYIRSLTATLGVPGPNCRPWNPPYQPGPGLDAGDVKNWTCGAGLGAVSDSDADTLKTLFPQNINAQAIAPRGQLNAREIPISMQLPDWNHWVPRIHPKDAWGSYFTNSVLNKEYNGEGTGNATYNVRSRLSTGGTAYSQGKTGSWDNDLYYWGVALGEQFSPSDWGSSGSQTVAQQQKVYATYQWQLIKAWEIAQDFNLETNCPVNWKNAGATKVEARGWCGFWRFAFDVSPHALNFPEANSMFGNQTNYYTKANQWYYMQLLLNPGNGGHNVHLPMDWQYAYGVLNVLGYFSGRQEPARNLVFMVKGAQEMDNGVGVTNVNRGWTNRDTSPNDVWQGGQNGIWKGTALQVERDIVTAYMSNWVDVSNSFNLSTWQRIGANPAAGEYGCGMSMRSLCAINWIPQPRNGNYVDFASVSARDIPLMRAEGINGTQLNRFATWLNAAYPAGGFAALVK
jgi:hypothetical protein